MKTTSTAILAATGLLLMYHTAGIQPEKTEIEEITREKVGEKATVQGEIKNLTTTQEATFFTIESKNSSLKSVTFRKDLLLVEGLNITAQGRITIHRGETEIIINRAKTRT